jgi:hypothetical protein
MWIINWVIFTYIIIFFTVVITLAIDEGQERYLIYIIIAVISTHY